MHRNVVFKDSKKVPAVPYSALDSYHPEDLWTDPNFDAGLHAFYYARVIQIATPRRNVYDSKKMGTVGTPGCISKASL